MIALAEHTPQSLAAQLVSLGFKPSHAAPLLRAFYAGGGEIAWDSLILPVGLRERLSSAPMQLATSLQLRAVAEDGTTKLLLRLADGRTVESVLMPDYRADRAAGCLSTQVGCAMGCDFCATTRNGFERNLSAAEIVEQLMARQMRDGRTEAAIGVVAAVALEPVVQLAGGGLEHFKFLN